jgi:hypothetical protein
MWWGHEVSVTTPESENAVDNAVMTLVPAVFGR